MPDDYYGRSGALHLDGTAIFQTAEDQANEASVAALVSRCWKCNVRSFGALSPVDWYAERHGRLIGILELKSRSHEHLRYPTVFLNVRKWLALSMAGLGLRVPSVYVVKFTDTVRWAPIAQVDASNHSVAGCTRIVKSVNDIEPVIEIPIASFNEVAA